VTDLSPKRPFSTVYGYPRQGHDRELKKLVEGFWTASVTAAELSDRSQQLRAQRWTEMAHAGIDELPSNDFSLYDHVLDTVMMVGAIPRRFRGVSEPATTDGPAHLARYFAMARGTQKVSPLEMTKWFDTNYHYLVPELGPDSTFTADATKPIGEFGGALALGHRTRPVLLGPLTFLRLAKPSPGVDSTFDPLALLDRLLPVYADILQALFEAGAEWVQLDEPILSTDQPPAVLGALARAYQHIGELSRRPKVLIATYFDTLGEALPVLSKAPVDGLAVDLTGHGSSTLDQLAVLGGLRGKRLVAGVVDGRNVWTNDLTRSLQTLATALGLADRVDVSASCSLLHVPLDVEAERGLNRHVAPWLSFARQKLGEVAILTRGLREGAGAIAGQLSVNRSALASRATSPITIDAQVRARAAAVQPGDIQRATAYAERVKAQRDRLDLPLLPTTTIGSFPQTTQVRSARADLLAGHISADEYRDRMQEEIRSVVALQEELGLDVLVHGEPERNDMVQYFAEQLDGYLVTKHGWVQSYGTRCVRPPILVGDVSRSAPMTVSWTRYTQQLTSRPVKGMLTGPVTMLAWSFVRDDQPLADTARQVALAIRDEVADLEAAGTAIIQVDEPALRETLPPRSIRRAEYLGWAVEAFRLATGGVADDTQIHTHMCYADFGDILESIVELDADVISLEAARSDMSITREMAEHGYPNEVGPGVYDIHSPRIPDVDEAAQLLRAAVDGIPADRVWVNPDCGLKTRGYPEVRASLANLVAAARRVRAELAV